MPGNSEDLAPLLVNMDHILARSLTLRWWPQVIQNATPLSYSAKNPFTTRAILAIDRLRSIVPKVRWGCVNMAAVRTASGPGAGFREGHGMLALAKFTAVPASCSGSFR